MFRYNSAAPNARTMGRDDAEMDKMSCVRKRITDVSNDSELMPETRPTVQRLVLFMFTQLRG